MTDEFDINKLAVHFAQQHAERFFAAATSGVRQLSAQVRARLDLSYKSYLERILDRYGRGKSFFVRTESTPLYDFFVPLNLATQRRRLVRPGAAELTSASPYSIISGSGGSGKSMMMRHMLVSSIARGLKTPIFLELRQLNQGSETVRAALLRTVQLLGLEADETFFAQALSSGQFLVLLDGFDELERAARKRVVRDVQELVQKYPKNWLIMSSRPDETLQGWEQFSDYHVEALDLDAAAELIAKLPFEEQVKERFLLDMREQLYEQHKSFMSNPLLLSIMLLTYGDVAHIPHKLSTFYSQAYEALFHRHDALKSGFQRERRSGLDIQDYARAFSGFCLLSYDAREFSFSKSRALELAASARSTAMLSFDDEAFLGDAVQATCLLIEEGLEIVFAHRSFQEYFVAKYIHSSPPEVKAKLVARFAPTVQSDSVMSLLWEIDPYIVEKQYLLPGLAQIREAIGGTTLVRKTHLLRYLRLMFSSFERHDDTEDGDGKVRVVATSRNSLLNTLAGFAFARYRDGKFVFGPSAPYSDDSIVAAFINDHGGETKIPAEKLKLRGHLLKELFEHGMYWGGKYLQALMDIEQEILAKHQSSRESLESLLAVTRPAKRKVVRAST